METIKTALKSRTNWAFIVAALAGFASKYGYEISPVLQGEIVNLALNAMTVAASAYGIKRHTDLKVNG